MSSPSTRPLQLLTITTALLTSGHLTTLSLTSIPLLKSQPASRALPMARWLLSHSTYLSHLSGCLCSSGFFWLAYHGVSAPRGFSAMAGSLGWGGGSGRQGYFGIAGILTGLVVPFTAIFLHAESYSALGKINDALGGTVVSYSNGNIRPRRKHQLEEQTRQMAGEWPTAADELLEMEDAGHCWDWRGPMERTRRESSKRQDEEVRGVLEKFGRGNWGRAFLMGIGGVIGLVGVIR